MNNGERCLQTVTGSCGGCNVLEIARGIIDSAQQSRTNASLPVDRAAIAGKVAAAYCPEGTVMQVPERIRRSVW